MKKILALFLVMVLVFGLCACGSKDTESEPEENETEEVVSSEPEGSKTETTSEPTTSTPKVVEPTISGLVLCNVSLVEDGSVGENRFSIFTINPETGSSQTMWSFSTPNQDAIVDRHGSRKMFSKDFKKLAATKIMDKTNPNTSQHAGWYDKNGIFTDVIGLLGLDNGGEWDKPKSYRAVGFSDDGYFVYYATDDAMTKYSVPIENISADKVETRDATLHNAELASDLDKTWYSRLEITSWADDTHCIANDVGYNGKEHFSRIGNFQAGKREGYIYGDDEHLSEDDAVRWSYDGVTNPANRNEVVFLSCQRYVLDESELYKAVVGQQQNQPQKLNCSQKFTMFDRSNLSFTRLLDWVQ